MTSLHFRSIIVCSLAALCLSLGAREPLAADDTVKIGAILAVTGPVSYMGEPQAKTLALLVKDMNARGGLRGRTIELTVLDSQGDPNTAVAHAKTLIGKKVTAIIGPSTSREANAVKQLCEDSRTVLLSCGADPSIVNPVMKFVFKVPSDPFTAVDVACRYLKEEGIVSIALLTDDMFGRNYLKRFDQACAANGIAITAFEGYSQRDVDFTALIARLKSKKFQAVVNWSNGPVQAAFTRQLRRAGIAAPLVQSPNFGNLLYVQATGPEAEGVAFPANLLAAGESLPDRFPEKKAILDYRAAYRRAYNEEATAFGGHAADAFNLFAAVVNAGGTETDALRRGIEGLRGFAGVEGVFNYSASYHGGPIDPYRMVFVRNGNFSLGGGGLTKSRIDPEENYRPVVAVMDFQADRVGAAEVGQVTDIICGGLVRTQKYYVVEKKHRENLLKELQMSLSDAVDPDSQVRIGKWLGANKALAGAIGRVEGKLLVTLKLIDMETSVTESSVTKLFASVAEVIERSDAVIAELCR